MVNENSLNNLRPGEYHLTQEEAKKGGINSGESRKQKKLIAEALKKALLGVNKKTGNQYVDDVVTAVTFNTAKKGTAKDLKAMADILGETTIKVETTELPPLNMEDWGDDD